jgi:hypothetical protein
MKAYKKRMVKEYFDLVERIEKLGFAIEKYTYDTKKIDYNHYRLMVAQHYAMRVYGWILRARLEDLGVKVKKMI